MSDTQTDTRRLLQFAWIMSARPTARLARTICYSFLTLLICTSRICGVAAIANEFRPVRERLAFSADRTPIDIEVVGSTSQLPKFHKLLPELVVRFRLERAYVQLFADHEPGFELLSIAVDFETGLPMALAGVENIGPRSGMNIPDTTKPSPEALRRRNVVLSVHSDRRVESFRKFDEKLVFCHGDVVENGMWAYEPRKGCSSLGAQKFGKIAQMDDGSLSEVECDDALPSSWARCEMRFSFEGFSVGLNFDRDLLPRWREVVSFSAEFLKAKRY